MKLHEIKELIRLVDQSSIDELELENDGVQITLKKAPPVQEVSVIEEDTTYYVEPIYEEAAIAVESPIQEPVIEADPVNESPVQTPEKLLEVVSPWVGVFTNLTVKVGEKVEKGQILCNCNVEPLKLYHEIRSAFAGEVVEILAEEGQLIEYGQNLFVVKVD
ncbi:biotin/lipoyl-containing protein [Ammoniphilus sp. CFH 90114]|uniref:acetyl-CoA carboxylase biotin carboxyl carrier protein n=1 Tax=Ammoniphilus sp. CFH 90114 TaxID=2493665 RepID=UPI00100DA5F6|nr:biotin/lipoyl-containing protein [Ammoniphilus sp. CFH 90114]RXT04187.1 acetyl-CoA carboxylase biotin carboxyl carrier protein [Ammoniphilus sp. CFH 90114]